MKNCERNGSLDSNINNKTIIENDFVSFFIKYPKISYVYFNGATAEKQFKRKVLPKIKNEIRYFRLPSTSPAMAQMSMDEKISAWSKILSFLNTNQFTS